MDILEERYADPRWHSIRVEIRNDRNKYAKENPLSIIHAITKFAQKCSGTAMPEHIFFKPTHAFGSTIRKGSSYEFNVIMVGGTQIQADCYCEGFINWLSNPENNFSVVSMDCPVERCVSEIVAASDERCSAESNEICLDFHTPLALPDASRKEIPNSAHIFSMHATRLNRLFPNALNKLISDSAAAFSEAKSLANFMEYNRFAHQSKSNRGTEFICGNYGPMYLRGRIREMMPLLLLGEELSIGRHTTAGQGAFYIKEERTHLDIKLGDFQTFRSAWASCDRNTDFFDVGDENVKEAVIDDSVERCSSGKYKMTYPKIERVRESGHERIYAVASPSDMLVQTAAATLLESAAKNIIKDAAISGKKGSDGRSALQTFLNDARKNGCKSIITAKPLNGIESISKDRAYKACLGLIPYADKNFSGILHECIFAPHSLTSKAQISDNGIMRGLPASEIIYSIGLKIVDDNLASAGFTSMRQGEEFYIAAEPDRIDEAISVLKKSLQELGIFLDENLIGVFNQDFSAELDDFSKPQNPSNSLHPLYIQRQYAFIGIDGESAVIREDDKIVGRAPLNSVGGIYLLGSGCLSSKLIQKCADRDIPISLCTAEGWHFATMRGRNRNWYERVALHALRYESLQNSSKLEIAKNIVRVKILSHLGYLQRRSPDAAVIKNGAEKILSSLDNAKSNFEVMGCEGRFAALTYTAINRLVSAPEFRSENRAPRKKHDRWNCLLDTGYSLLFCRIESVLQGLGVNPYLGFLHSSEDTYPSLVCDLQEPFRHRIDAMSVRAVAQNIIQPSHFCMEGGRWRLTKDGRKTLIEQFEAEMDTLRTGCDLTLRQKINFQCESIREWAEGGNVPAFRCLEKDSENIFR